MGHDEERIYVTEVISNVKGGISCQLGPKTLIVGPNESGKSAVVNAVELALRGSATRIAGREEVAKEADLLALAPPEEALVAWVRLSDGQEASFTVPRKAGKAKRKERQIPAALDAPGVFPLLRVESQITGSPEVARKFLLQYAVGRVTGREVLARIPAPLQPYYQRLLTAYEPGSGPLDHLVRALEDAGAAVRAANDRARGATRTLDSLSSGIDARPGEAELAEAKEAVAKAAADLERMGEAIGYARSVQMARNALAQHQSESAKLRPELEAKTRRLAELRIPLEGLLLQARQMQEAAAPLPPHAGPLLSTLRWNLSATAQECGLCGTALPPGLLSERARQFASIVGSREQAQAALALLDRDTRGVQATIAQTQAEADAIARQIASNDGQIARFTALLGQTEAVSEEKIAEVRASHERVVSTLQRIESAAASWRSIDQARETKLAAESEVAAWKQLVAACSTAIEELLDGHVASFVARVQARLPPTDKFFLQLREGTRACVRVGLQQEGAHTALSESAWARVIAALADACADAPGGRSILVPSDRDFDAEGRARLLESLSHCDAQVIVTFANWPARIPQDWTVIDTAKGEHRKG